MFKVQGSRFKGFHFVLDIILDFEHSIMDTNFYSMLLLPIVLMLSTYAKKSYGPSPGHFISKPTEDQRQMTTGT